MLAIDYFAWDFRVFQSSIEKPVYSYYSWESMIRHNYPTKDSEKLLKFKLITGAH